MDTTRNSTTIKIRNSIYIIALSSMREETQEAAHAMTNGVMDNSGVNLVGDGKTPT
jgi:hypothetical protein